MEWARAALDDALDCAMDFGTHSCRPACFVRRRGAGVVCRHGFWHLEWDGERWVVAPGKALVPGCADVGDLLATELAARVDPGLDRGGQSKGAVCRVRTHAWETRGAFAVALACRCNHDVSVLEHHTPEDAGDADDLARALNDTRDATSA
eukprot:gene7016-23152_t